jgi:hypothetical protein
MFDIWSVVSHCIALCCRIDTCLLQFERNRGGGLERGRV